MGNLSNMDPDECPSWLMIWFRGKGHNPTKARVLRDSDTGSSRGFGFIEFAQAPQPTPF